jgi:MoaA/NifB/PqqE/SkfB family radical SAM enzyme
MNCQFCFSNWREKYKELDTKSAMQCIEYMKKQGLEAIGFTGGEALMRIDMPELLAFSKKLNLTTILTTNGILLEQRLNEIAKSTDFIGLPLDSYSAEIHNKMRPTKSTLNHYELILGLIEKIEYEYKIGLKINTVVTKQNYDSMFRIGELLEGKAKSWKLSHFVPSGFGKENQELFNVSTDQYKKLVQKCKESYPSINIISTQPKNDFCRIISVDGHLLKPIEGGLEDVGDLLTIIKQKIEEGFNSKANEAYLRKTYPQMRHNE